MKKLTFDDLTVELTRDCNMVPQCNHCYRGDAQSITIDKKHIDYLLSQTEIIGSLLFTGGEPFLCVDKMNYFLDQLYQRKIPLFELDIISNGLIFNDEIVNVIKRYSDMIRLCNEIGTGKKIDIEQKVVVGISIDKYHYYSDLVKSNLEKYKTALKGYAQVVKTAEGNMPGKEGRGKALSGGLICSNINVNHGKRIEILDCKHKPMCPYFACYKMVKPDQIIVCCGIYLNAKGFLLSSGLGSHDYSVVDDPENHICSVSKPIYDSIIRYNHGRLDCCSSIKKFLQESKKNPFDFKRLHDAVYILLHSQEVDSDPIKRENEHTTMDNFIVRAATNESSVDQIMANAAKHNYLIEDEAV